MGPEFYAFATIISTLCLVLIFIWVVSIYMALTEKLANMEKLLAQLVDKDKDKSLLP